MDLRVVTSKRLLITGSTLRSRPVEEKRRLRDGVEEHVWPLLRSGRVRPVMDRVFPMDQAGEAHRRMERSEHIGKIVLRVDG